MHCYLVIVNCLPKIFICLFLQFIFESPVANAIINLAIARFRNPEINVWFILAKIYTMWVFVSHLCTVVECELKQGEHGEDVYCSLQLVSCLDQATDRNTAVGWCCGVHIWDASSVSHQDEVRSSINLVWYLQWLRENCVFNWPTQLIWNCTQSDDLVDCLNNGSVVGCLYQRNVDLQPCFAGVTFA